MAKERKQNKNDREPTFEEALARLEEIAAQLEGDSLSLQEAIALAEEGQRLMEVCEKQLSAAEAKIHQLVERSGDLTLEPFETEGAEEEST